MLAAKPAALQPGSRKPPRPLYPVGGGPGSLKSDRPRLLTTRESSRAAESAGQRSPSPGGGLGTGSTSSLRARHFLQPRVGLGLWAVGRVEGLLVGG